MVEYATWMFIYDARIRKQLKTSNALSEDTAKTIEELNLSVPEMRRLRQLVTIGKVKETSDGRFYAVCKDGKHC